MQHVVTQPRAPFPIVSGALEVHQIPSWTDNLIWLLVDPVSREAAAVDGPEADTVTSYVDAHGLELTTILNTHTHPDHIGINRALAKRDALAKLRVVGASSRRDDVPGLTEGVVDGDEFSLGSARVRVMATPGHIDGHISFVFDGAVFCGDTMFGAGCGYLFDGPPSAMHESLQKLAALPESTLVCCAHEYTQDNLRFAWSVESDNADLAARIRDAWAVRARGECTVPSRIGLERATNPFLRTDSATIRASVRAAFPGRTIETDAEVFAATRALKDRKDYRELSDERLPL